MKRQNVIDTLKAHEADLRARGVRHAALFGSIAREAAGPESDIDIMIDLEPGVIGDIYSYVGLKTFIAGLFPMRVDVVNRKALKPYLRPAAEAESVDAF